MKIIIEPGESKFSVHLKVDFNNYFKSKRDSQKKSLNPLNGSLNVEELAADIEKMMSSYEVTTSWWRIKKIFMEQCDQKNLMENQLLTQLTNVENGGDRSSLALRALDFRFIELPKNSIDALIKPYLLSQEDDTPTMLELKILLKFEGDKISVIIQDNAGGFPKKYLDYFSTMVAKRSFKDGEQDTFESEKASTSELSKKLGGKKCFVGGCNLGLRQLGSLMVNGMLWDEKGNEIYFYSVTAGTTSIELRNTMDNKGAEIELSAPLEPLPRYVKMKLSAGSELCFLKPLKRRNLREEPTVDTTDNKSGSRKRLPLGNTPCFLNSPTRFSQNSQAFDHSDVIETTGTIDFGYGSGVG